MITSKLLEKALRCSSSLAIKWAGPIDVACFNGRIDTPTRVAAFLAQVGHESNGLRAVVENLNYSAKALRAVFGKYYKTPESAAEHARRPELIANRVYGGRMGNGSEGSGDGWRYRGRGLIQLTGKNNYVACGKALGVNLLTSPNHLAEPVFAARSAVWFWNSRKLNVLADAGDFERITRRINGGLNGQAHRLKLWTQTKIAIENIRKES